MKYDIEGEGDPVVVIHGSYGGLEQSKLLGKSLRESGFQTISISRPGYPGTPIDEGRSSKEQTDLIAEVMEENGIESAHLLGYSLGGEIAIQMLIRHPEKVRKTVMDSAVISVDTNSSIFPDRIFRHEIVYKWPLIEITDYLLRTVTHLSLESAFKMTSESEPDEKELESFENILDTTFPLPEKKQGIRNDFRMMNGKDNFPERIEKPVLAVNYEESPDIQKTTEKLQEIFGDNLEIKKLDNGGHMTWMQTDERKKEAIVGFLSN